MLYRRTLIYTAPSGTGKTSVLRAGLFRHLRTLGLQVRYVACRTGLDLAIAHAITPAAPSIATAVTHFQRHHAARLVLIVDQLEAALSDDEAATATTLQALAARAGWPADADVTVLLCVREDFLARLLAGRAGVGDEAPIVRLGPLGRDGAREAITGPLRERRLDVDDALLGQLLDDLEGAAATMAPEMGWGGQPAVYPPHLQLACAVLHEALGSDETTLTLAHYRRLGGFDTIVGEYLERVLDTELTPTQGAIARDVFLALVTATHTRTARGHRELLELVEARHAAGGLEHVLEVLRSRGLVVPTRDAGDGPGWELAHDSLVRRIEAWIDRQDLARRRAIELVRYHLRRSQPAAPSLLDRRELRDIAAHADAIDALDRELAPRAVPDGWTPARLVRRSRQTLRRRTASAVGLSGLACVVALGLLQRWDRERDLRRREAQLRDRDLGRFVLEVDAFDWDARAHRPVAVDVAELPTLAWTLHEPAVDDPDTAGSPIDPIRVRRPAQVTVHDARLVEAIEARGGDAFLRVTGRGRAGETCAPAQIPLGRLPGYAARGGAPPTLRIRVPSCRAGRAGMIEIAAGPFIMGGVGTPAPIFGDHLRAEDLPEERVITLEAFAIDRTEVTNAAFAVFATHRGVTAPIYPNTPALAEASGASHPVADITWSEARAFCRYVGKELPTDAQWVRTQRGGLLRPDGTENPAPRRNLPWGEPVDATRANLSGRPAPVGTWPGDVSPDGVLDLAGNVQEWTASIPDADPSRTFRNTRGANWSTPGEWLVTLLAIPNGRSRRTHEFMTGVRCVSAAGRAAPTPSAATAAE